LGAQAIRNHGTQALLLKSPLGARDRRGGEDVHSYEGPQHAAAPRLPNPGGPDACPVPTAQKHRVPRIRSLFHSQRDPTAAPSSEVPCSAGVWSGSHPAPLLHPQDTWTFKEGGGLLASTAQHAPPTTSAKAHLLPHFRPDGPTEQPQPFPRLPGLDICSAKAMPPVFANVDRIVRLWGLLRSFRGRVGGLPPLPLLRACLLVAALHGGPGNFSGRAQVRVPGGRG